MYIYIFCPIVDGEFLVYAYVCLCDYLMSV